MATRAMEAVCADQTPHDDDELLDEQPALAVPLASARQCPENQKGKPGRSFVGARGGGPGTKPLMPSQEVPTYVP